MTAAIDHADNKESSALSQIAFWNQENMTTFAFFYYTGVVHSLSASALIIFSLCTGFSRALPREIMTARSIPLAVFWLSASLVLSAYLAEIISALHSSNLYERYAFIHSRLTCPYCWAYYLMLFCQLLPQLFWLQAFRRPLPVFCVALCTMLPRAADYLAVHLRR